MSIPGVELITAVFVALEVVSNNIPGYLKELIITGVSNENGVRSSEFGV